MDAYVSKIDPAAGKVIYTTRLGGNKWDGAIRIEVDQYDNAYVAGFTESSDFPTTSNALRREYIGGKSDAFLVKLKADGEIEYSTFFGGGDADQGNSLALDKAGNVYLAGTTWSNDLPGIEKGSSIRNSGRGDGFVAVWNLDQPSTLRAKYIGGKEMEKVTGIALDDSGNLFISGFTQSVDFPLRAALQKNLNGKQDAFLIKLRRADLSYRFSTLIGGAEMALGRAFAPEEDQTPGAHPVMVLSHICWTRLFNSDPHIVGRTVRLAGFRNTKSSAWQTTRDRAWFGGPMKRGCTSLRPSWVDFRTSPGNEPLTVCPCLHFSFEVYLRLFCRRSRLRQY